MSFPYFEFPLFRVFLFSMCGLVGQVAIFDDVWINHTAVIKFTCEFVKNQKFLFIAQQIPRGQKTMSENSTVTQYM